MKKTKFCLVMLIVIILCCFLTVKATNDTFITIDYPLVNESVNDTLLIKGWVMSKKSNADINIYIDNNKISEIINRTEREDVIKYVTDYGDRSTNPTPGFETNIDLSNYSYGKHTITVESVKNGRTIASTTREFLKKVPESLVMIDYPNGNTPIVDDILIKGWIMSEYNNPILEVYIDNVKIEQEIERHEREDVIKSISGYGGVTVNPTPGFQTTVDLSNYSYGKHNLKIILKDKSGNFIKEETKTFEKKKPESLVMIDYPNGNTPIVDDILIKGWIMSEYNNPILEVYIDNVKIEQEIERHEREDVIKSISGYGGVTVNPTPGFQTTVDLSNYSYGKHNLKIILKDKSGNFIKEETKTFEKKKPATTMIIDSPNTTNVDRNLYVRGWVMSETGNKSIEILINGEKIDTVINSENRKDVLNAVSGYGGITTNPTPGFNANIDMSNYLDGDYKITVNVYSSNGVLLSTETKNVKLKKYDSILEVTSPINDTYKSSLSINGYVLSEAVNTTLEVYLDNNLLTSNLDRFNDNSIDSSLLEEYGGTELNYNPNFNYNYSVQDIYDGSHSLTINLKLESGEIIESKKINFKVKKYDSFITLDYPSAGNINKDDNLFIKGWVMSEDSATTVKIYLDNKEIIEPIDRHEREDVLQAISGYGGRDTNSLPGYSTNVDLSSYSTGYHTLTIKIFNHLNEEFNVYNKSIYVYDGFDLGIDVSQHNGIIDWNAVKNSGGVDFAFIRLGYRGYGAAGNFALDSQFVTNVNSASNVGIDTGIYFFSQATNYQEGVDEARYVLNTLNMNPGLKDKLDFSIMLDVEYSTDPSGNGRADHISNEARSEAVRGFLETMNSYGLRPGIYANKDFLVNKLDLSRFNNYDIWLAHWTYDFNNKSDYNGAYKVWQYSNCGSVFGINGCVDLDISYQN